MSELTDRLRGQYNIGPSGEFGTRSFADFIPPISLEAADRIDALEHAMQEFVDKCDIGKARSTETYGKFQKLLEKEAK